MPFARQYISSRSDVSPLIEIVVFSGLLLGCMDSKTTVAVERTTFAKLDRLAKANSVSKMEYITHAINYFEKYGINPVEHESPAQEMQKLIKRMDKKEITTKQSKPTNRLLKNIRAVKKHALPCVI